MTRHRLRSILAAAALLGAISDGAVLASEVDAEARVLAYIREHVEPGRPLLVTELYNSVFTQPEERKALDKLYKSFFRIPLYVTQHQEKFGSAPTLKAIAEQFDLKSARDADTLLRVMESDPRVPRFIQRDAQSGEITRVDTPMIRSDHRFGQATEKHLSGWTEKPAPDFVLPGLDSGDVSSTALRGKTVLLYVWFTGCPPCMKQTPELVALDRQFLDRGLVIVGANADKFLGLGYDDAVRRKYAGEQTIKFPIADWTRESDAAFGSISIYPTLFLIDSKGVIMQHWVGYTSGGLIRSAVMAALIEPQR
jgi:thiol-disulfide isomerase/thioredoxin